MTHALNRNEERYEHDLAFRVAADAAYLYVSTWGHALACQHLNGERVDAVECGAAMVGVADDGAPLCEVHCTPEAGGHRLTSETLAAIQVLIARRTQLVGIWCEPAPGNDKGVAAWAPGRHDDGSRGWPRFHAERLAREWSATPSNRHWRYKVREYEADHA